MYAFEMNNDVPFVCHSCVICLKGLILRAFECHTCCKAVPFFVPLQAK